MVKFTRESERRWTTDIGFEIIRVWCVDHNEYWVYSLCHDRDEKPLGRFNTIPAAKKYIRIMEEVA